MNSHPLLLWQRRFDAFHTRLFPQLSQYLTGHLPRQEAEEIAQEALLKVYQKLEACVDVWQHSPESEWAALAFSIAKNMAVSRVRHLKVRRDYQQQQALLGSTAANTEQQFIDEDLQQRLVTAMNRLPPICRTVFIMRKLHQKSYQDIAKELQISVKTVENHLARGMKLCRQYLLEQTHTNAVDQVSACK